MAHENNKKTEVGTQHNPLEVEVIEHVRFDEPGMQSFFITAHMVIELYDITKELRKA